MANCMDILDEMTKEEILEWIRGQAFFILHLPCRSELLFSRWQTQSEAQQLKYEAHLEAAYTLDMKQRDKYARQFNATTDLKEKLVLMKKMEPYDKKLKKHFAEYRALSKEDERIARLYDQIDVEITKENIRNREVKST